MVTILYFQPFVTRFGAGMSHFMTYEEFHSTPFTLESERLMIRRLTMADDEAVYAYGKDVDVARYVIFPRHESIADSREFIVKMLENYEISEPSSYGITLKNNGKLIGTIGFADWEKEHNRVEIGYAIGKEYWNKGFVTEATKVLIDFLFTNTDLIRIESRCQPANIGSFRVMEKAGMTYEGTLRKHTFYKDVQHDMKYYSILREEWSSRS